MPEPFNTPRADSDTLKKLLDLAKAPADVASPEPISPVQGVFGAILGALDPAGYERLVRPALKERELSAQRKTALNEQERQNQAAILGQVATVEHQQAIEQLNDKKFAEEKRQFNVQQDDRDDALERAGAALQLRMDAAKGEAEFADSEAKRLLQSDNPILRYHGRRVQAALTQTALLTEDIGRRVTEGSDIGPENVELWTEAYGDLKSVVQDARGFEERDYLAGVTKDVSGGPEGAARFQGQMARSSGLFARAEIAAHSLDELASRDTLSPEMQSAIAAKAAGIRQNVTGAKGQIDQVTKTGIYSPGMIGDVSKALDDVDRDTDIATGLLAQAGGQVNRQFHKVIIQNQKVQLDAITNLIMSESAKMATDLLDQYGDLGGPVMGTTPMRWLKQAAGSITGQAEARFRFLMSNADSTLVVARSGKAYTVHEFKIFRPLVTLSTDTETDKRATLGGIVNQAEANLYGLANRFNFSPEDLEDMRAGIRKSLETQKPAEAIMHEIRAAKSGKPYVGGKADGTTEPLPDGMPVGSVPMGRSRGGNPVWRDPNGRLLEVSP